MGLFYAQSQKMEVFFQMSMQIKKHSRRLMALLLCMITVFSLFSVPASAAQQDSYHDPAENWQEANNRTN